MAVAPQGTTPPVAETGRPISSQLVCPPKRGTSVVLSIYFHDGGGQAGGVAVDGKEERLVAQHFLALADEVVDAVLQLPDLAAGAAAIAGRVHDDAVVGVAAALFAGHELGTVVHQPADGPVGQAAGGGVVLAPGHDALGGIHMADGSTRRRAGQRGTAGVAEQVQHLYRAACGADLLGRTRPS